MKQFKFFVFMMLILFAITNSACAGTLQLYPNETACTSYGYFWYNGVCNDIPQVPGLLVGGKFSLPTNKTMVFNFLSYIADDDTGVSGSGSVRIKWQEKSGTVFITKQQTVSYSVVNVFISIDVEDDFSEYLNKDVPEKDRISLIEFAAGLDERLYIINPNIRIFLEKQD